jgi:signal transduction histidine kinase
MESLLHDVRNPLNALAINAEVLSQKLKGADGLVPAGQEKNLKAIREQVQRVDAVLRRFAQFIAPSEAPAELSLSGLVRQTIEVLGHESRRCRVKLVARLEGDIRIHALEEAAATFAVFRPILRAIEMSPAETEVVVQLTQEPHGPVLLVRSAGAGMEPHRERCAAFEVREEPL